MIVAYIHGTSADNVDDISVRKTKEEAVRIVYDWFEVDRNAKKPYVEEMEEMYKLYKGDHWDLIGPHGGPLRTDEQKKTRPNAVENATFSLVEGLVAEFSQDVEITDFPVEEGDDEAANVMSDLKRYLYYKNRIIWEREKFLRWFFLYGTGIWHTYWDPSWRGGKGPNRWEGDVRWKALHPNFLFPDARCKESVEDGRRVHKAQYVTLEAIREMFKESGQDVQSSTVDATMLLGDDLIETPVEVNEDMVLLIETWYKGKPLFLDEGEEEAGEGLHILWWAGDGNETYL